MGADGDRPLADYEVLLALTGGIACYKSADLASRLTKTGCGVTVALSESAGEFIRPLTFQALTHRRVYTSLWTPDEHFRTGHISLTEQADLMVIAPATANVLAKLACGIADDLVSTMALASCGACDLLIAPAMNTRMWNAPPTQANLATLRGRGVHVVGPGEGNLACGTVGPGRMSESADILQAITDLLKRNPPKNAR
jgi:phosphopantothenoylcysteine decarboxylase/phosphopantothenate--cysteine ligase